MTYRNGQRVFVFVLEREVKGTIHEITDNGLFVIALLDGSRVIATENKIRPEF